MVQADDVLTPEPVAWRDLPERDAKRGPERDAKRGPERDTKRGLIHGEDKLSRSLSRDVPPGKGASPRKAWSRRPSVLALGAVLLAAVAGGGYLYWDNASHFEATDDAFIAARQFAIAPKVSGYIAAVPVTDNQHVEAGQVIARIDDRDYRTALAQAEAQVEAAQASIANIDAQITVQQAQVAESESQVQQKQASLTFAQQQASRYTNLAKDGWGTVQDAQQYTSRQRQGEAALRSAQSATRRTSTSRIRSSPRRSRGASCSFLGPSGSTRSRAPR